MAITVNEIPDAKITLAGGFVREWNSSRERTKKQESPLLQTESMKFMNLSRHGDILGLRA